MTMQRRTPLTYPYATALSCAMLTSAFAWPAHASDRPLIAMSEPAGFASLTAERTMVVDLYFGGARRGEARVDVTPGSIRFVDPRGVLSLLPSLESPDLVLDALSGHELPSNSELRCSLGSDPQTCGRMAPSVFSVIFDPDRFRVDIFLNPRFVSVQSRVEEQFLPRAQGGPSLINSIGAVLSGQFGERKQYSSVFDQLILAEGDKRLRADVGYTTGQGFEADRVQVEWDRPGVRYSAGAMWSPGSELEGRRKFVGGGVESQIDTRLDKDTITGSPIVFYLEQRARVDVLREGRLLSSAIYEAGNQQIDSSNLPEGSYDITLHIEEPGRAPRDERRFFTKSRRIPSLGRTDFFLFGGVLIDDSRLGLSQSSDGVYFHGGVAIRASRNWAFGGSFELGGRVASSELSATYLTSFAQVRAAAVANTDGTVGGILQLASAGTSRLNFNFDLRRVMGDARHSSPAAPPVGESDDPAEFAGVRGSYSQLGGLVSYNLANLRFLGTGFYREEAGHYPQYSISPALEWDVLRRGRLTLTVRGDMTVTERGNAGFAGMSLRLLGPRSTYSALAGARASSVDGDDRGDGAVAAMSGSWSSTVAGGDLSLGAGLEHQPKRENAILSGDFRHPGGSLSLDVAHTDVSGSDTTQYSMGFQTTLAAGGGRLQVAGKTTSESLLIAHIDGAEADDTFEVLVNEQPAGTLAGTRAVTLALPGYRSYRVRIRPTGERLLAYDSASRAVALYPGTVARVEWRAAPITIKVGRLVDADGSPVRGAVLTARGAWAETDDQGHFQIEAPDDVELTVALPDGTSFASILPTGRATSGVFRVGTISLGKRDPKLGLATRPHYIAGD
ncbi:TcfC E-set like domain-containing protein [Tsuneonella rigui]|uniref:TcfC E-set like domain-containing protein n=1 Tax=Tsuneonella rigui TaxID=1708790 RepID=UPI000F7EA010|nr:TcfC E-set like domain-containing protein [Tsuneonella rigui]